MDRSPYAPDSPTEPTAPSTAPCTTPCTTTTSCTMEVSEAQVFCNDDLPELECAVCFSQFNNVFNTPKVLQCGHTFCLECLARINIKSSQPDSLQCPLCRAYTPVPTLGLPKLATDIVVLSCLPEAMQRVYSIHFNRNRGKLQLKGIPSSVPPSPNRQHRSLDLGEQVNTELEQDPPSGVCPRFILIMKIALFIIVVSLGITVFILHKNELWPGIIAHDLP
ncbi:RING finger protein 225-like [Silurus meridionalis]|uniref:RING finger protein 225-like n=1 Tax=Silurus meridionalis TaxID=175797 RepID=UPI001EE9C42A|nr:RING finger protein 225-like [Silurus meridionalis]